MKNEKGISLIALIFIIVLAVFALVLVFGRSSNNENSSTTSTTSSKNKSYGLGDTITFDGLELTFDSNYSFEKVASTIVTDYNGDYIKLGVTIKNVSNEKNFLNTIDYDFYGSKGTQLTKIAGYFDNDIYSVGNLKPGASYKAYFYIFYDGNGNYSIDFHNFSLEEVSVEFKITK